MFTVGIVGCGAIANVYAQAIRTSTRATLVAVCDTDEAAATRFADAQGAAGYADHRSMFDAEVLDGVIVCTPPATHAAITIDALGRGLNVICEKPFAIAIEDAEAMVRAAAAARTVLTMGSKFRYVADVANARTMIAAGMIGAPVLFENVFTSFVDMRSRWNSQATVSGGGVLIDNGTHSVDIMRYFLGPVASVRAIEGRRTQGLAVDETVNVMVRNPAGVIGEIDLSWSIQKTTPNYIEIYGTEGTISVGWRESKWTKRGSSEWTTFGTGYDKVQAFRSQIDNFVGAVAGTEELVIGPADALASVEVVGAIYRSMQHEQWVDVASRPRGASVLV
jgi:predicted dehydrogenase